MSRAHMLYDDKPLEQTAVETSRWPESWKPVARLAIKNRVENDVMVCTVKLISFG